MWADFAFSLFYKMYQFGMVSVGKRAKVLNKSETKKLGPIYILVL